ncbi:hypothetical protein BDW66DRAFT_873 [Aspergillus desertorum]
MITLEMSAVRTVLSIISIKFSRRALGNWDWRRIDSAPLSRQFFVASHSDLKSSSYSRIMTCGPEEQSKPLTGKPEANAMHSIFSCTSSSRSLSQAPPQGRHADTREDERELRASPWSQ